VEILSEKTGLSESQVYKWAWDQKKKFIQPSGSLTKKAAKQNKRESASVSDTGSA
jgi:hypothetical protein